MSTVFPGIVSVETSPDWITVVTDNECDRDALRRVAEGLFGHAIRVKPWRMCGYTGRCATELEHMMGGIAYGENLAVERVGALMQAWGNMTELAARKVMQMTHYNISRMDYACTVLFRDPLPSVREWTMPQNAKRQPRIVRIVPDDDGGGTIYIGARGSALYGRIYDKGAQLGTMPARIYWRWEVEYKGKPALKAYELWDAADNSEKKRELILREVTGFFLERNLPMPDVSTTSLGRPVIRYATRIRSGETTIQWLKQQVGPALDRLAQQDRWMDVLDALGLDPNTGCPLKAEGLDLGGWSQDDFLAHLEGSTNGRDLPKS